jgi:hypothetical protein
VLGANQHPDHDTIAAFRRRHLKEFRRLFVQVLEPCQAVGLVKLGRVALDGTKMEANASKQAMSYDRMLKKEKQLQAEIDKLLRQAEKTDAAEDARLGKGNREDSLPEQLKPRESRLKKIQEAKALLQRKRIPKRGVKPRSGKPRVKAAGRAAGARRRTRTRRFPNPMPRRTSRTPTRGSCGTALASL